MRGGIAPFVLNLGTELRPVDSFMPPQLYSKSKTSDTH